MWDAKEYTMLYIFMFADLIHLQVNEYLKNVPGFLSVELYRFRLETIPYITTVWYGIAVNR